MIAIDTNVLIRYLVQDDPVQAKKASETLETAHHKKEKCFLSNIVLCETVWVLESAYDFDKKEVLLVLEKILKVDLFLFENKDVLRKAIDHYTQAPADFSDYLIGLQGKEEGAETTFTFDKSLKDADDFTLLH